eukprot:3218079-Prymnesium_polylepis.1
MTDTGFKYSSWGDASWYVAGGWINGERGAGKGGYCPTFAPPPGPPQSPEPPSPPPNPPVLPPNPCFNELLTPSGQNGCCKQNNGKFYVRVLNAFAAATHHECGVLSYQDPGHFCTCSESGPASQPVTRTRPHHARDHQTPLPLALCLLQFARSTAPGAWLPLPRMSGECELMTDNVTFAAGNPNWNGDAQWGQPPKNHDASLILPG